MQKTKPTKTEYQSFQTAFDFFNVELFGNSLPQTLITLQRRRRARGYFCPNKFKGRTDDGHVHEIAMNPKCFGRTDREIMSTLVHEQTHEWQQEQGKISRNGYHNREWAEKMKEVGLYPSHTGKPGGKETGQRVTHYIVNGGPYDKAFEKFEKLHVHLSWRDTEEEGKKPKGKDKSKTKFTCRGCGQNVWAKEDVKIICGVCKTGDILTPF